MRHRQIIAVLSLVGFFVALYLSLYEIGVIGSLRCGAGGCDVVQTSRWADLFGIPVAVFGVAGYAALLAVSLAGLQPSLVAARSGTVALAALSTVGFLFSVYLTYLELFVIHAICRWCVASAAIMTAIWIAALVGLRDRS